MAESIMNQVWTPQSSGWHWHRDLAGNRHKVYVAHAMFKRRPMLCVDGVPVGKYPGDWLGRVDLRHG